MVGIALGCDGGAAVDGGGFDATARECQPTGAGVDRRCPDGCEAIEGRRIDLALGCVTTTRVVVLCYPSDVTTSFNGMIGCFERSDGASERVSTGTTGAAWEGGASDNFAAQGWAPCDEPAASLLDCE